MVERTFHKNLEGYSPLLKFITAAELQRDTQGWHRIVSKDIIVLLLTLYEMQHRSSAIYTIYTMQFGIAHVIM